MSRKRPSLSDRETLRIPASELAALAPLARLVAGTEPPREPRAAAPPAAPVQAKVLVVDDDNALRRVLAKMLQRLGHAVVAAGDGREALALAEQELPDLVITDLSMPEMTGHELLTHLKSNERTRHIPVIVVSGEGDSGSVVQCLEQGAEDHLTKPYERVVLQARIGASLERKRMRDLELAYLRRVAQLTAAAEAVEQQSYRSEILEGLAAEGDELGQLARVFDRMVSGIRAREARLESQVRQLRREIGEASIGRAPDPELSADDGFASGQLLVGRFEVRRELGKGGMGTVYLARDHELGEDVAVKVVRPEVIAEDPSLLERLKTEMRLARRISHRNVVRSHDFGEWEGIYFLTMEYIEGITVAELIATRGRLGVDATVAIGTQLADALAVAHAAGIIHRDIKPQNLLVDGKGTLKVTDFGLARPLHRASRQTQSGFVVGTPMYMAPEQLLGDEVDARSDLYAAGVVLYECLTGRVPFDAVSPLGLVTRMIEGPPTPIRELEPGVPERLAAAIGRLLDRDPEMRFQSARELAEHLALVG